jgi:hypothetical protein
MAKRAIGRVILLAAVVLSAGACRRAKPTPTLPDATRAPPTATARPMDRTPSNASPAATCDVHEPNDTRERATVMVQLTVSGCIGRAGDVDYFRTPATYGGSLLDFTVALYDLPADYDLYVYDSANREIARSTNRGSATEHIYYYSGPQTGNSYWLKIVGANGASNPGRPYTLRFTMNPGTPTPRALGR